VSAMPPAVAGVAARVGTPAVTPAAPCGVTSACTSLLKGAAAAAAFGGQGATAAGMAPVDAGVRPDAACTLTGVMPPPPPPVLPLLPLLPLLLLGSGFCKGMAMKMRCNTAVAAATSAGAGSRGCVVDGL
jgi:hypothetical protein